jgi:hypothetical protein
VVPVEAGQQSDDRDVVELRDGPPRLRHVLAATAAATLLVCGPLLITRAAWLLTLMWGPYALARLAAMIVLVKRPRRWLLGPDGLEVSRSIGSVRTPWRDASEFTVHRWPLPRVGVITWRKVGAAANAGNGWAQWPFRPMPVTHILAVYDLDADQLVTQLNQHRAVHLPTRPDTIAYLWDLGERDDDVPRAVSHETP